MIEAVATCLTDRMYIFIQVHGIPFLLVSPDCKSFQLLLSVQHNINLNQAPPSNLQTKQQLRHLPESGGSY